MSIDFKARLAKGGDPIRAEDWNYVQQGLVAEIQKLRNEMYNMSESVILAGVESHVGRSFGLDELVRDEHITYGNKTMGLITKQWLTTVPGEGEICSFGIMDSFDILYYWGGASKGDVRALDITIAYMDRPTETIGEKLYVNDRKAPPSEPDKSNPWLVALKSANNLNWYKYQIINPFPENDVKYVTFTNSNPDCTPRIGNVVHLKSKIRQIPTSMNQQVS